MVVLGMTANSQAAIIMLRSLADRLEQGEVESIKVSAEYDHHPLADGPAVSYSPGIQRLIVEVIKVDPKKDC